MRMIIAVGQKGEAMDDIISRQSAIECVYGSSPNRIKGRIAELPAAEPKWIPCSERLPEEGEGVLWCTPSGYVCSGCVLLGHQIDDCGHQGNYIAWMPLPEPYKEG